MAVYPLISSPCPYKGPLSDIMDGDICRLCHKQVHDLTDMTDEQRRTLMNACADDLCVSYKVTARTAATLAALAVAAVGGLPAAAQPPASDRDDDIIVVVSGGIAGAARGELVEIATPVEAITDLDALKRPPTSTPAPKQDHKLPKQSPRPRE